MKIMKGWKRIHFPHQLRQIGQKKRKNQICTIIWPQTHFAKAKWHNCPPPFPPTHTHFFGNVRSKTNFLYKLQNMGQVWYAGIYSIFWEGCPFSRLLFGQMKKISFLWLLSRINCPCQGVNSNDSLCNIQWRCLPEWMSGNVWHSFHWSAPAKTRKYKIQNTKIQRRTTKYEWMAGVGHSFRC